jgi:hypothetical protein
MYGKEEGKGLWKLDRYEWEVAEMYGRGKFSQHQHCQRFHFEVKMNQKTLDSRAPPGPAGGA